MINSRKFVLEKMLSIIYNMNVAVKYPNTYCPIMRKKKTKNSLNFNTLHIKEIHEKFQKSKNDVKNVFKMFLIIT